VRLWWPGAYQWQLPVSPTALVWIQRASWAATAIYFLIYAGHLLWCARTGHALNPMKYLFVGSSYFLWYFTSWHTDSLLVFGIAHRLMHGVQYIVIVNSYLARKLGNSQKGQPDRESDVPAPGVTGLRGGWRLPSHRALAFF